MGSLTNLTDLWLYDNQLEGGIPTELGKFTALRGLGVSGNRLTGPYRRSWGGQFTPR